MLKRARIVALSLAAIASLAGGQSSRDAITGSDLLQVMHNEYATTWYRTLTFAQKTTTYRVGAPVVSTWYESLRYTDGSGTQLRIDIGDPSAGNGVLYTADSSWNMRGGKLARASNRGNEFLPLIEGVYVQPVARTVQQLTASGLEGDVDLPAELFDPAKWTREVAPLFCTAFQPEISGFTGGVTPLSELRVA
jgi:hypothetical protein